VRLEGSLDAFSLPDIFSLLSMTKKTGGLHLRRSGAHGVVWLGDGLITGGASDLSRLSLGRRLAGSGHVADNLLSAAVDEIARNGELGIARALRDSRAIDEGELHNLMCEHVVDTVFDLMRWTDGVFEFIVDEANIDDVGVAREVDEVVTEARRRLDTWAAIDVQVASPDTVLSLALDPDTDPQVQRNEWALLALVDGRRTVGDLVAMCGRGDYSVVVALAELVGRGLVRTNESEGVAALLRRQTLIATLEPATTAAVSEPEPTVASAPPVDAPETLAELTPEPESTVREQVAVVADNNNDDDSDSDDGDSNDSYGDGTVTEIGSLPRFSTQSRDPAAVTPQRPEPFLPSRQPEHPEPVAASVAGGGMVAAAAAAAMPADAIERDPSVNKSLLLRLIAGVRGL
jgi:Domain of unknown function (DUF4388)